MPKKSKPTTVPGVPAELPLDSLGLSPDTLRSVRGAQTLDEVKQLFLIAKEMGVYTTECSDDEYCPEKFWREFAYRLAEQYHPEFKKVIEPFGQEWHPKASEFLFTAVQFLRKGSGCTIDEAFEALVKNKSNLDFLPDRSSVTSLASQYRKIRRIMNNIDDEEIRKAADQKAEQISMEIAELDKEHLKQRNS